jgi:glucose/mannose-6-phosphate isomerase
MLSKLEVESIDTSKLYEDYENWPQYCEDALSQKVVTPDIKDINRIIYAGMGGSGASGDILADGLSSILTKPFHVTKDYHLPKFVSNKDLVIVASASGNTAESLSIAREAFQKKCGLVAISTGGQLEEFCKKNQVAFTKTKMLKVPRSSFPYLFFPALNILLEKIELNIVKEKLVSIISNLKQVQEKIRINSPLEKNPSKKIASKLWNEFPIIYSSTENNGVANRFKTALNENSKMIAHTALIPELCHNEIEGWKEGGVKVLKPIFIRNNNESPEIAKRFEVVKEIIEETGVSIQQYWEIGDDYFSRALSSIYLLDYASIYAAILRKRDPIIIPNIDNLKNKLA